MVVAVCSQVAWTLLMMPLSPRHFACTVHVHVHMQMHVHMHTFTIRSIQSTLPASIQNGGMPGAIAGAMANAGGK